MKNVTNPVTLIASGSHEPGVSAAEFSLPPNAALRYERPDPQLRPHLTNYHVMDSVETDPSGVVDWMLPGWAAIRITLSATPIAVTLANRRYDPVPSAAVYGVTSRAMAVSTHGGVTIGIGLSPSGWARLFRERADRLRDRITSLDTLMKAERVGELVAQLRASDRALEVKPILDRFFADRLQSPHPDEPVIAQILALIADDTATDIAAAAADLGIDPERLRRLSNRYFGFPPKTLMVRARFMRSFLRMFAARDAADYSLVAPIYHDRSHFLRDARRFLGMTPRQFMAMKTPYLDAVMRGRAAVLNARDNADGLRGEPTAVPRHRSRAA